jgi:hypothetical protein
MINCQHLLSDLQRLLRTVETDLLERSESSDVPEVGQTLQTEYQKAKKAERTAQSYEEWRSDYITQIAAAWVLSCVFARFLEDNRLVDPPRISGQSSENRLQRARDEHELYFRTHPTHTDREYLLWVFSELRKLPACKEIFSVVSYQLSVVSKTNTRPSETDNYKLTTDYLPPLADIQLLSIARLTDVASKDAAFMEVAALYRDDPAFDVQRLVTELVEAESVPLLPVLRYKDTGLRKRAEWKRTWELQREEDKLTPSRENKLTPRRKDAMKQGTRLSASAPLREGFRGGQHT